MATKRKKRRHRGAVGKANTDLTAHIQSLGLTSVSQYQAWCRDHGFNGALNKSWQERRQERKVADRALEDQVADRELQAHIQKLGLMTVEEYVAWCTAQGLSTGTNKSRAQRKKEVELVGRLKSEAVLAGMKAHTKRLPDTIRLIFEGKVTDADLKRPHLKKMHEAFESLGRDRKGLQALLSVLLHTEKNADLFGMKPAITRLGPQGGNTFIEGLATLASWHKHWIRSPEDWRPNSHNSRKQFGALVRHLLVQYEVPTFMDMVWFLRDTDGARQQQTWFVQVGIGQNIRKLDVPVNLTKKMAHLFLQAPDESTVLEAFRWGQILGLGGETPQVRAINGTRLGSSFEHEDFWHKVVHFFVNNPMLDPDQIGPLVDYIYNQKYVPQEEVGPEGLVIQVPPAQPNFSIKGRSMNKLLRQVDYWHRQLARETRLPPKEWWPSGIGAFDHEVIDRLGQVKEHWRIQELLSSKELSIEGRQMHHCVASYAHKCQGGNTSVWSMQVEDLSGETHRVMTIAVNNRSRSVTQSRGRHNALPSGKTPNGRQRGFEKAYQHYLRHSKHILYLWREQEELSMSRKA
ncbi:MAG: PcfJ domain-containing protein [bacterium]|nr:PcfJ domain-containing protein [bacterium]